jgi:GNAT superfamily N-acetyltransferase
VNLVLETYDPARDAAEALALDRGVVQGERIRLSFHRSTFHRRCENFARWHISTARLDGRLVGLAAVALKDVVLHGEPRLAAFGFDLRVDPAFRRQRIGRQVSEHARGWARDHGADLEYSWVIDDNRASLALAEAMHGQRVSAYAYLVVPTHRRLAPRAAFAEAHPDEVHERHRSVEGPFDLYGDPRIEGRMGPRVGSWAVRDGADSASCSAWDNREILGEIVQGLPPTLAVASAALRLPPLRWARLPAVPVVGRPVASWYLYDAAATRPDLAVDLVRGVVGRARARGIDYLYLAHTSAQRRWVDAVRAELPSLFAPVVRYVMVARSHRPGPPRPIDRPYVDVRDL